MDQALRDKGIANRKAVLGEDYVNKAMASADDFNKPFQDILNEYCWGLVWSDERLPRKTRSMLNLVMLACLNRMHEWELHLKGALRNGVTKDEIQAIIHQIAIYAGVPLAPDFTLDLPALLEAVRRERPALVFIAYPNNPSGNLFDAQALEQVIQAAPGLVVIDEAYHAFAQRSFVPRLAAHPNLLVMRTLSKLGLAGLRLGLLIGRAQWLGELDKVPGIFAAFWILLAVFSGAYLFRIVTEPQAQRTESAVASPATTAATTTEPAIAPTSALSEQQADALIQASKAKDREIDELKSTVQSLSGQVSELSARLKPLEKVLGPVAALPTSTAVTTSPPSADPNMPIAKPPLAPSPSTSDASVPSAAVMTR